MYRTILLILLFLVAGCSDELDRPIRIVVPPDLKGPIAILADPDLPDRITRQADAYVITVPDDGLVRTNNLDVFHKWHGTEVVDTAGNPVTDVQGGQYMSMGQLRLIWFYRGPKAEHDEFMWDAANDLKDEWLRDRGLINGGS